MQETLQTPESENAAEQWPRLRAMIDDVLHALDAVDREAVLPRFFEGRAFAEIGAALQLSDEAARKRVDRALDKMEALLARRGVTSTTGALALALATQAGVAAPVGLASNVAQAAFLGEAAVAGSIVSKLSHFMQNPNVMAKIAGGAAMVAAGVALFQASTLHSREAELDTARRQRGELSAQVRDLERRAAEVNQRVQAATEDNAKLRTAIETASLAGLVEPQASRIAFVIDTSGSMRNVRDGGLHSQVYEKVDEILSASADYRYFQFFDADGRSVLGDLEWRRNTPEGRTLARQALHAYKQDTNSNPAPGIERALDALDAARDPRARLHVYVLGDELNDRVDAALMRIEQANPADANGRRRIAISGVGFALKGRVPVSSIASTFVRYERLMRELANRHGGTFSTVEW